MKNFKRLVIAVVAMLAIAAPAEAQFRFGVKAGVNINSLSMSEKAYDDVFDASNQTGYLVGVTTEFTVPIIGIGFDASLTYTHRKDEISHQVDKNSTLLDLGKFDRDYISIPINLKYKLGLPAIGKIITPYAFTGPEFSFLCSKKAINDAYKSKAVDTCWNLGIGVELLGHLQIGAYHSWGLSKTIEEKLGTNPVDFGKTNAWTVTAAYMF